MGKKTTPGKNNFLPGVLYVYGWKNTVRFLLFYFSGQKVTTQQRFCN
jgi:hypothetical protein